MDLINKWCLWVLSNITEVNGYSRRIDNMSFRKSNGYTEETLEQACQTVISFINSKYPGQIEEIKEILQDANGGK